MADKSNAPPKEAVKQADSSYIEQMEDGSTMRYTRRPDGTWRKPEHRRAGFVGELEQAAYVSKGKELENNRQAAMQAQLGRVPGAPPGAGPTNDANMSAAARGNARKKEKRQEKAEEQENARVNGPAPEASDQTTPETMAEAAAKNEKNIRKKLRQIEELEAKQKQGDELNEDQALKVAGKKKLEAELKAVLAGEVVLATPAPAPAAKPAAPAAAAGYTAAPAAAAPMPAAAAAPAAAAPVAVPAAGAKSKKAIEKKLKQVAELEEKERNGEELNYDQKAKLASKKQLQAELKTAV